MIGTVAVIFARLSRSQSARLVALGLVFLFAGAAAFSVTQSIGYGTALYWAITTATTVGYGDITPANTAGRIVASGVMLTTIPLFASGFAVLAGAVASAHLRRLLGMERAEAKGGEVLILGLHRAVVGAARELVAAGREVIVVTKADPSTLPPGVKVVGADPLSEEGVRGCSPEKAMQILIAGEDDAAVLVTAVLAHRFAPDVPTLAIASSKAVTGALRELGIAAALSADELLTPTVAKSLEAPHAGELLLSLVGSEGFRLQELPVGDEAAGRRLSEQIREDGGMVLGAVHGGKVLMSVAGDPVLDAADQLLVLVPEGGP